MNWADWLNAFCVLIVMELFLFWPPIYSVSLTFIFYWFFPYGSNNQIKFILKFLETWSNLHLCRRGPIKSVLFICPYVCLSVCLSVTHFLRIYSADVFNFLHEDILLICFSKDVFFQILEICIWFLDNWVNKTNLDKKQNIWHFNRVQHYFLCFKWCPITGYMILWKLNVWGKSGSQFVDQNAPRQSGCRIF